MRKSLTTLATIASISRRASMGARSLLTFASRLAGKRVSQGGLMAWGGWSSLAALQRCIGAAVQRSMHLGINAQASCVEALETRKSRMRLPVAFLGPGLRLSACIGTNHGGRRALKMVEAIGRGSSNLVNAAGS